MSPPDGHQDSLDPFLNKQDSAVVKAITSPEGSRNDSQLPLLVIGLHPCTKSGPFSRKCQGPPGACLHAIDQHIYENLPHFPHLEPCVALTFALCSVRPPAMGARGYGDRGSPRAAQSSRCGVFHHMPRPHPPSRRQTHGESPSPHVV